MPVEQALVQSSCPEQGRLQDVAQASAQACSEYLQGQRLPKFSGQPEFPVFQFVPITPCPVPGHHCEGKPCQAWIEVSLCVRAQHHPSEVPTSLSCFQS